MQRREIRMITRLRQAVIAAAELEPVVERLRTELGLGEPFSDPAVAHFGLRNAVFALGDTFLEVVSPARDGTAAGRQLERRGGDCGYMLMFQVPRLEPARERARGVGVREVFDVSLEDISEVHLHPADMRGAIVALSEPRPPESWRWGGPDWASRSAPLCVSGAIVAVRDPALVEARWRSVIDGLDGVRFVADEADAGVVEITVTRTREAELAVRVGRTCVRAI
jgi:hypothetical protein